MGCAGSTPKDPSSVLVALSGVGDLPPLAQNVRATSGFLELQTRAVKGSTLARKVTAFEVVGGSTRPLLQAARGDDTFTVFDQSEKPAVLVQRQRGGFYGGPGAVLYARDAPDMSNGKGLLETSTEEQSCPWGNSRAPASKNANGVLMRAVGQIKMIWEGHRAGEGRELGYGLFLLGADGAFSNKVDLFFDHHDVFFQCVKNQKGEVVAYRTLNGKQYYVAAGVDAVLVIALAAVAELTESLCTAGKGVKVLGSRATEIHRMRNGCPNESLCQ